MKPTLYLLMGLPGAGKTTAAKIIEQLTGAMRLSSDEERLKLWPNPTFTQSEHDALYKRLDSKTAGLLAHGKSVIYDANLNRFVHREEKYALAKQYGASTQLIWVQTERELAKRRRIAITAHHALVPSGEDPGSMFERIASILEPPRKDEPVVTLDGTAITSGNVAKKLGL